MDGMKHHVTGTADQFEKMVQYHEKNGSQTVRSNERRSYVLWMRSRFRMTPERHSNSMSHCFI